LEYPIQASLTRRDHRNVTFQAFQRLAKVIAPLRGAVRYAAQSAQLHPYNCILTQRHSGGAGGATTP
ncbi:MAG: hypothetical protein ACJ74J_05290, partial [Blastocatellia bacterium]